MNERIRELAAQALDRVVPYTWTRLDYDEIQKVQECFAELIVQECARQVTRNEALNIFEHFGVEH